ncbi:MAG: hypothetical protein UV53_C0009G0012 [Candidatus Azambacteria bacterium GW2011_GWE1_42_9]|nr:MAG: hypothetical protein UV39_C0015G0006 [Candidatus Azambacteria bacterium GW2011_GWA2_42_62]KKS74115.1 MAG: hypothetical protein UV45_C0012G0011 [Candidatus Azambacteria bacterium GW2011_GWB1_42_72]KKS79323.1 MAG: hypothetical protein UV53_C0009G0012 [Candidatus Azambacteria bacterium GW2011_GWE1_42_9]KKT16861.1 MAG: hypothetical protein UV99_C0005G0020 [Parcubacteria group bacterium GW2011_GWC1_43_61]
MRWLKENREKIIEKVQLIIFTVLTISAALLVFVIWFLLPSDAERFNFVSFIV